MEHDIILKYLKESVKDIDEVVDGIIHSKYYDELDESFWDFLDSVYDNIDEDFIEIIRECEEYEKYQNIKLSSLILAVQKGFVAGYYKAYQQFNSKAGVM